MHGRLTLWRCSRTSQELASFAFCKRRTGLHCFRTLPCPEGRTRKAVASHFVPDGRQSLFLSWRESTFTSTELLILRSYGSPIQEAVSLPKPARELPAREYLRSGSAIARRRMNPTEIPRGEQYPFRPPRRLGEAGRSAESLPLSDPTKMCTCIRTSCRVPRILLANPR